MQATQINDKTGIYIHIPFCDHLCYYCNFNKVFIQGQPVDDYIEALLKEIRLTLAKYPHTPISTIYIGGGTPTALSAKQLARLFDGLHQLIDIKDQEFTVEANPNDLLDGTKLPVLREYGVNRLSIGVQSFNDDVLKKIGRTHSAQQAVEAVHNAQKIGFDNISIDLIYRLPGQDLVDFNRSLQQALALDIPHYATYSLILEQKTVFYNLMRRGKLHLPSQDMEADMYQLAMDQFAEHGVDQYEISNFAKPGFQAEHNLIYWHNQHYFGFGAGASGYLGATRYQNFGPIQQYLKPLANNQLPVLTSETITRDQQIEEQLFLGLRLNDGVSKAAFKARFGEDLLAVYPKVIPKLIDQGLLRETDQGYTLTTRGRFIGNDVFTEFMLV
ncbi:coproporphyrinogen III oxidase [Lapidilactobacillus concavus DSM 17758]|jgi:oxygen-independent coproporphyrinogen-3 oxidase|uniref:Heme chaperone HemW n=1 Tax=Lapidilactobacillus concavus DSM 17758 TaxID=1423735 RepID=A0A0R1VT06_9LACO|nr:radical SAM family heme chaperone HemW [Lapidilactobacillus concavus]KRM08706.1 coproporphyrinogen III oxidase [Lapidilactobacillus concavus DSM 17758]GEL14162.1 coproporphyrinogen III oxidase [Lapidilactobacillus concavus]